MKKNLNKTSQFLFLSNTNLTTLFLSSQAIAPMIYLSLKNLASRIRSMTDSPKLIKCISTDKA